MRGRDIVLTSVVFITAGSLVLILTQESLRNRIWKSSQEETEENPEVLAAPYVSKSVPDLEAVIDTRRYRTADAVVCCEAGLNFVVWGWLMKSSRRGDLFLVTAPMYPHSQELFDPNIGSISQIDQDDALAMYYRSTVRHRPFEEIFPNVTVSET